MTDTNINSLTAYLSSPKARRYTRLRHYKDVVTRHVMALGGISVILAIVLIAFYLLWVVLPMFRPAQIEQMAVYDTPGGSEINSLYMAMEEQREVGFRFLADGKAIFFNAHTGEIINEISMLSGSETTITGFSAGDPSGYMIALGLSDGTALLAEHVYRVSFPDDVRVITPDLFLPMDGVPIIIDERRQALKHISAQSDGDQTTIAAISMDAELFIVNLIKEESFLTGEAETIRTNSRIPINDGITHLRMDIEQRELYLADENGRVHYYDISDKESPRLIQEVQAVPENVSITSFEFLSGGISILIGDSRGQIAQWFPVRDEANNYTLEKIRYFDSQEDAIDLIVPEYYRKGLMTMDASGTLGIYHTTAHRTVKIEKISDKISSMIAIAPRSNAALIETGQRTSFWHIDNEHPEISWSSIWGKVWYESRDKPEYIWQSSSASSDFEPKFSLTPLAFGTMKASLYAMLFAIPLAIMGAIYTAYFMAPRMRNMVKPTIEIMAALPTVILGFLAGLWFAPLVEANLPGLFLVFLLVPLSVLFSAWAWQFLPRKMRIRIPDGWEAAMLIPILIFATVIAFWLGTPIELWLFNGNMPLWLGQEMGITYDQRNSMIVGIAIGFAVIPTIFSISEDAIFGVPKHLTIGSLALGATPWQTMARVVLLTASPGIFSAVMIGLGRAVGETMIVVMATGNTAIMDMNIFEGFRALSANIAVEMPESAVGSTHYRILFLAGLVLFMATFVFNTIAEVVRQSLRQKYSSL